MTKITKYETTVWLRNMKHSEIKSNYYNYNVSKNFMNNFWPHQRVQSSIEFRELKPRKDIVCLKNVQSALLYLNRLWLVYMEKNMEVNHKTRPAYMHKMRGTKNKTSEETMWKYPYKNLELSA